MKLIYHKLISILTGILLIAQIGYCQDLSQGLQVNDLTAHPMQALAKPAYLGTAIDPSFGTTIRRITDAGMGNVIVPMYSTIQAWNANESLMIVYDQSTGDHQLLNGISYTFIRRLTDVNPKDLEQIFWDFNNPDFFYYPENGSNDFIKYNVLTQAKQTLFNFNTISNCTGSIAMGNDIQMMSWDNDVLSFRCGNDSAFSYKISTATIQKFSISNLQNIAPMPAPSGSNFYHSTKALDANGNVSFNLNESSGEHSCLGKLTNGNDAHFAIAFAQGPLGGCIGDIIAHDLTTGNCFPVISQSQGYNYPQSGTHISALAHKNSEGGWMAASMMGYDKDGQSLLDQELVIAKAEQGNIKVCRIGHHRSDEDDYDYWGEPHAVISPSGTRVLYASDWSGAADGQSIDCYVVELPSYSQFVLNSLDIQSNKSSFHVYPNPSNHSVHVQWENKLAPNKLVIYNSLGKKVISYSIQNKNSLRINKNEIGSGLFYLKMEGRNSTYTTKKLCFY